MRCGQAASILNHLQSGPASGIEAAVEPFDAAALDELVRMGYVDSFTDGDALLVELEARKRKVAELLSQYPEGLELPANIRSMVAEARRAILDLSERAARVENSVEVRGRRYALTYRGRTLLTNLVTRILRVEGMDLDVFERELEALARTLDARAAKAASIFAHLRAALGDVLEADLRAAAVGLAVRPEQDRVLADGLRDAVRALGAAGAPRERILPLAECIVVALGARGPAEMEASSRDLVELGRRVRAAVGSVGVDESAAASLLFVSDPARREDLLIQSADLRERLAAVAETRPASFSPLILMTAAGVERVPGALTRFWRMRAEMVDRGADAAEAEMAAAVLVLSSRDPVHLLRYFETARDYLTRFSQSGMIVAAAMLAVLETSVDESLDDLRLASASIAARSLAPGGAEILSLGLKLLVQAALLASTQAGADRSLQLGPDEAAALAPFGLPGLALLPPVALTAVSAFHEVTVHRFAMSEYAFHPVHTHFIYG